MVAVFGGVVRHGPLRQAQGRLFEGVQAGSLGTSGTEVGSGWSGWVARGCGSTGSPETLGGIRWLGARKRPV